MKDSTDKRKLRILFTNIVGILGGGERSLLDIIGTLDREHIEPEVLLFGRGPLEKELSARGVIYYHIDQGNIAGVSRRGGLKPLTLARSFVTALACSVKMASLIRRGAYDIVHSNSYKTHYLSLPARIISGAKIIWHLREIIGDTTEGKLFRMMAGLIPHAIIANSKSTGKSLGKGRAADKVRVIYNGIDCEYFSSGNRDGQRREWGIEKDKIAVLHMGMLCPLKGQHVFVDAAQKALALASGGKAMKFIMIGQEAYETSDPELRGYADSVRARIEEKGLGESVMLAGFSNNPEDAYAAADIVACTSMRPESFGRVVAEAMAAGKPVVSFANGGPREIIEDGVSGYLVPVGETDALAGKISELAADEESRKLVGEKGRERALEKFDRSRLGPEIIGLYKQITEQIS
ncbi:MAG: glycosyltransferase family 4 protein [Planctomycetes bacterium]|nr:glycosyltransferase family 4 protein [Planctomycetota bacterium]